MYRGSRPAGPVGSFSRNVLRGEPARPIHLQRVSVGKPQAAKPLPKASGGPANASPLRGSAAASAKPPACSPGLVPVPPLVRNPKSPPRLQSAQPSKPSAPKPSKAPPKVSKASPAPLAAPPVTPPRQRVASHSSYTIEDADLSEASTQDWNLPPEEEWGLDNTALDRLPARRD